MEFDARVVQNVLDRYELNRVSQFMRQVSSIILFRANIPGATNQVATAAAAHNWPAHCSRAIVNMHVNGTVFVCFL